MKPFPPLSRRHFVAAVAHAAALPVAIAQPGTSEPLKLVIPFSAGATIDAVGRVVAQKYTELTKQAVVVDNRTGAGGIVGTAMVAKARPDGGTIVLVANNLSTTPAIRNDLPFDARRELAPIAMVGLVPYAVVVPPTSPANSMKELFDQARSSGQAIAYGTIGVGSHGHFIGVQMERSANVPMMPVAFKGQTEMMVAVMGGHLQLAVLNLSIAVKQMQERRVKVLATLTEQRHPLTPQIPTFSETGSGTLVENAWYGFLAPAATPEPALQALRRDIGAAILAPDVKARLTEMGIVVTAQVGAPFGETISSELTKYARIAKEANIKAE